MNLFEMRKRAIRITENNDNMGKKITSVESVLPTKVQPYSGRSTSVLQPEYNPIIAYPTMRVTQIQKGAAITKSRMLNAKEEVPVRS